MQPVPVPAPPVTVAGVRMGLLASTVGNPARDAAERWGDGFSYQPEGCGVFARAEARCTVDARDIPYGTDLVEWEPFAAVTGYACRAMPGGGERYRDLAERHLGAYREHIISAEFWTGEVGQANGFVNRPLASPLSDDLTPTTGDGLASLTHGLACLEQYLADTSKGQRGMVHATAQTVTHWQGLGLLRREGNRLLTALDTIVVPGAGYDGSAPDGAAAGAVGGKGVWAYATSMVDVRLGKVDSFPRDDAEESWAFDRPVNTTLAYAWQLASASWDLCAHGAIRLDISVCAAGGS